MNYSSSSCLTLRRLNAVIIFSRFSTFAQSMRLFALSSILLLVYGVCAESGGLYPPGLLPLINRANALLSKGQFNDAAKAYSEAIGACLLVHRPKMFCAE
jgi:hypothetical protein